MPLAAHPTAECFYVLGDTVIAIETVVED
jgi:hypothetical protein